MLKATHSAPHSLPAQQDSVEPLFAGVVAAALAPRVKNAARHARLADKKNGAAWRRPRRERASGDGDLRSELAVVRILVRETFIRGFRPFGEIGRALYRYFRLLHRGL